MTGPVSIGAAEMSGAAAISRVVGALGEMFADLAAGRAESPERTVLDHGDQRVLLVSPALWERYGAGSVKITTLTPGNPARGRPLIHGIVVLTDLATGRITALLDGAELTALRTGAVAALATRSCTPPETDELAMIGAGVQARALIRAIAVVRPIRRLRVFSRTVASAEKLSAWVTETYGGQIAVAVCRTAAEAVTGAPLLCTATSTSSRDPVVGAAWIAPGAHVNVIGGTHPDACEVDPELLARAVPIVEERAAALAGAGEVRAAVAAGLIGPDDLVELGRLDAAEHHRTTVLRTVGMAIEDTAAAVALAGPGGRG